MKKLLAMLLVPIFLTPTTIISTELEPNIEPGDLKELTHTVADQLSYYHYLPKNPVLLNDVLVFKDPELLEAGSILKKESDIKISSLFLNNEGYPVFKLANEQFIIASRDLIYDDIVLEESSVDQSYFVTDGVVTYESPYTKGTKRSNKPISAFEQVKVTKKALTKDGYYYEIDGYGWISERFLTTSDIRMQKVQKLLLDKYSKDTLSVYVKSLTTQEVAEINADKVVYAASVTKLGTLYYAQKQLDLGRYQLSQPLKYVEAVLDYEGAYDTQGSGSMSKSHDDKDYSVEHILKAIAKESDNAASNIAGYYLADQFDKAFYREIDSIVGQRWDMATREASAKMAGRLMEAIYEQDGDIITYLSETQFDGERISKDIPVQVAHKIGDAYDFRHDVAIIYTDEPFILSIFTENMSYDDITSIANDIYNILK